MSPWFIYFLIKLDSLSNLFSAGAFFVGLMLSIVGCVWFICNEEPRSENAEKTAKSIKKHFLKRHYFILFVCFVLLSTFLPSTKQAVVIYALPKIVNNEQVRDIPLNAVKLINEKMKRWLEEIEKKDE